MLTTTVDPSKSNHIDSLILFSTDPKDENKAKGIKSIKWAGPAQGKTRVTYSFMTEAPSYATDVERKDFVALSEEQKEAVEAAVKFWEEVAEIDLIDPKEVSDANAGGIIRLGASTVIGNYGRYPGETPADGDIWLKSTSTDILTMIHEIGHVLGLKHPGNYNAGCDPTKGICTPDPYLPSKEDNNQYTVMSYTDHPGSSIAPQTPMLYDVAAMQYLYGANFNTRAGDTIYGFDNNTGDPIYSWDSSKPFVQTIWDGGGVDTINAANQWFLPVNIDLKAGSFSSIGPKRSSDPNTRATNNLAIAYGVTIENAIGGSGDDEITGNEAANALSGGFGNDTLNGSEGDDTLDGSYGNDTLIDLSGSNQLIGGKGDDKYYINSASNVITEYADEGIDKVIAIHFDYRLGDNLENLQLIGIATSGWGNILDNEIMGTGLNNFLYGEGGSDTLRGESGDDKLYGGTEGDFLYGGEDNDYADGWEGDDYLYGGTADQLHTGTGNDVLVAWKGSDHIYGGDGEDWLDGSYDNDFLYGGDDNDILGNPVSREGVGGEPGDDQMYGEGGNDELYGGPGNDTLDGGLGSDTMSGRADNDTYFVDDAGDSVIELFGEGTDSVKASINYTLTDHVEHLRLIDTAYRGTGNSLSNTINGNTTDNLLEGLGGNDQLYAKAGNDSLFGGDGNDVLAGEPGTDILNGEANDDSLVGGVDGDTLTGGSGKDKFIFNGKGEGIDTITDFSVVDDTIYVSKKGFGGGLTVGELKANQFFIGSKAGNSSNRFIYDKSIGGLFFDIDGKGGTGQVQIAQLSGGLAMTNKDIYVMA